MADPRLVTVSTGPTWQVELLHGLLEEEGIDSFLPDRTTKIVDPFITGPNPLSRRLQVRAEDEARALEILRTAPDHEPADKDEGEDVDEADEETAPEEEVEYIATRTRWAALLMLTFPFAVFYGFLYLFAVRDLGVRAKKHGLTVAAFVMATALLIGSVVAFWATATR